MAKIITKTVQLSISKLAQNKAKDTFDLPVAAEDIQEIVQELLGDSYIVDVEYDSVK